METNHDVVINGMINRTKALTGTILLMQKTIEIKLKWFHIRIVQQILAIKIVLLNMGVVKENTCTFCEKGRNNIQHILGTMLVLKYFGKNSNSKAVNKLFQMVTRIHWMSHEYSLGNTTVFSQIDTTVGFIISVATVVFKYNLQRQKWQQNNIKGCVSDLIENCNNYSNIMAPLLVRASSTYKDKRIRSFHPPPPPPPIHPHTYNTNTCITGDGLVKWEKRKREIIKQKRRGKFSVLT